MHKFVSVHSHIDMYCGSQLPPASWQALHCTYSFSRSSGQRNPLALHSGQVLILLSSSPVEHTQDVLEEIDPTLEPVLAKSFIKRGNATLIKLGDKEVDYNPDFRLYVTTKMGVLPPHQALCCAVNPSRSQR